jgi:hypothetical protein
VVLASLLSQIPIWERLQKDWVVEKVGTGRGEYILALKEQMEHWDDWVTLDVCGWYAQEM